jgi:hypothetical protein
MFYSCKNRLFYDYVFDILLLIQFHSAFTHVLLVPAIFSLYTLFQLCILTELDDK